MSPTNQLKSMLDSIPLNNSGEKVFCSSVYLPTDSIPSRFRVSNIVRTVATVRPRHIPTECVRILVHSPLIRRVRIINGRSTPFHTHLSVVRCSWHTLEWISEWRGPVWRKFSNKENPSLNNERIWNSSRSMIRHGINEQHRRRILEKEKNCVCEFLCEI